MNKRLEFDKYVNEMRSLKDTLINEMSLNDKRITDINHIIELGTYTDRQAVGIMSILKACMVKRRKIKNKLTEIKPIIDQTKKWQTPPEEKEKIYEFRVLTKKENPKLIGLMVDQNIKVK